MSICLKQLFKTNANARYFIGFNTDSFIKGQFHWAKLLIFEGLSLIINPNNMELVADLIKVLLPATLVLWAMYLTISSFIKKELIKKELDIKAETSKTLLPIRLQAYERMALFLERISQNNLLIRLSGRVATVAEFQQLMLAEIREEFSHNLSQQVYMSDEAWLNIKNAMNEIVALINLSSKDLAPEAPSLELSKRILEVVLANNIAPSDDALKYLKQEMRNFFM